MKKNKGFCYEIFKNQAFWSYNQSISYNPCSFYDGFIDKDIPPEKSWYGENHRKIIEFVQQDKLVQGCHRCYAEEDAGRVSRRMAAKIEYEEFSLTPIIENQSIDDFVSGPEGLDYSVGNLCNLKCIICGPHNSSSWIPDYQKIHPDKDISGYLYKKEQKTEIQNDSFLKNIKKIHFHGGGEPLLSDAHFNLLKKVKKVKGLSDVRVFYNTNGTCTVSQEILELWEECKLVELYFSIDDIGPRFEYQRTGASWHVLLDNIQWFKNNMPHNHMFKVNCVWGYLNLFYLDEFYQWHQRDFGSSRYGDTCHLIFQKATGKFGIQHLSQHTIDVLKNKFSTVGPLLDLLGGIKISDADHNKFWQKIDQIDQVRYTKFKDICPEWSRLL